MQLLFLGLEPMTSWSQGNSFTATSGGQGKSWIFFINRLKSKLALIALFVYILHDF
jgi:hypothetical protein